MAELLEKHELFIDALIDNKGNVAKAAEAAGLSTSRAYQLVHSSLRKEIIERAESILALHAIRAANTLVESIDEDSRTPMSPLRLEGARQVLDRIGIVKKEQVQIDTKDNVIFILPPKDGSRDS